MAKGPQTVWLLTDGKAGDLAQCRGIAAYLPDCAIEERVVKPTGLSLLPVSFMPLSSSERPQADTSPIRPPYPDLIIATGRRTLPYLSLIKRRTLHTKIVFLKNPGWFGRAATDLIWAPVHDGLPADDNAIIETDTSPHRFTKDALVAARLEANQLFPNLAAPVTGIFLGGNSKSVQWDTKAIANFAATIAKLPFQGTILITPSRRTPDALLRAVRKALARHDIWVWDGQGNNPYLPMLARADHIVVTGDSHNMVSEALASGACVHVYRPPGLKRKFQSFLDRMEAQGAIQDTSMEFALFPAKTIDATPEIAAAIRALFK